MDCAKYSFRAKPHQFHLFWEINLNSSTASDQAVSSATEIKPQRVLLNAVSNYLYYGLQVAVMLILQAYVVREVGKAEYSLWPLCLACMNLAALIPLGVGAGVSRFIAAALANKDIAEAQRITSTLFLAFMVAAVPYLAALLVVGWQFEHIFEVPDGTGNVGPITVVLLGIGSALLMPFSVFRGCLDAGQAHVRLNVIRGGLLVAKLGLVVSLFTFAAPSLIWVAVTQVVLSILEAGALYYGARRLFPWRHLSLGRISWRTFRTVNTFSILSLVAAIAGRLYWDADSFIINKALDPVTLAGYAICTTILLKAYQLTSLANRPFAAPFTILYEKGEQARISSILYRANRLSVPVSGVLLGFFFFFGDHFLQVYVGSEYTEYAFVFQLLAPGMLLSSTQNLAGNVPAAFGRIAIPSFCSLAAAVANCAVSLILVLVFDLGLAGVAIGTLATLVIYRILFWNIYVGRLLDEPWAKHWKGTVLYPLANCIPALLVLVTCRCAGLGHGIWQLGGVFIAAATVQAAWICMYGMDRADRAKLEAFLRRVVAGARHINQGGAKG